MHRKRIKMTSRNTEPVHLPYEGSTPRQQRRHRSLSLQLRAPTATNQHAQHDAIAIDKDVQQGR